MLKKVGQLVNRNTAFVEEHLVNLHQVQLVIQSINIATFIYIIHHLCYFELCEIFVYTKL